MNSLPPDETKKLALRCDFVKSKRRNIDQNMERKMNAVYRESEHALSTDSGESSGRNSVCNDLDYQTSFEYVQGNRYNIYQNSRDEIADQLSKLKIGYNNNLKRDSGTVDDMSSEDINSHSIIAGNSPNDLVHHSIHSIPDSRCSIILAGRLDSKDDLFANINDHSILNTAINESVETNSRNQSIQDEELSRYVDSLEIQREEISSCVNERDSLEEGAYCVGINSRNLKTYNILSKNDENLNPNSMNVKRRSKPKIISNIPVHFPIKLSQKPANKNFGTANSEKKECFELPNNNSDCSEPTEDRFKSLMADSERLVIADIKTPNIKAIQCIKDCHQSSQNPGINADTFASDFITDISNLSNAGVKTLEDYEKNVDIDYSRDKIVERYSRKFAEAPVKFTEKLVTLIEQSIVSNSNAVTVNEDCPDISLSRLTEEFRKICNDYGNHGKRIEDESIPDFGFGPSFNASTATNLEEVNSACKEATASPFHNFNKLGGGKKVYRKTPRKAIITNSNTNCSTPNCANIFHRVKNSNLYSSSYRNTEEDHDSTATFEFWENLCYEMSPTKQKTKSKLLPVNSPSILTHEDLIRKSDQQMAFLDQSTVIDLATDEAAKTGDFEKCNLSTTSKDCQGYGNSMQEKFIENLSSSLANADLNQKYNYNEIEHILTTNLVQKRRKCFEEARKVFETKESGATTICGKSLAKVSEFIDKNESLKGFIDTLAACNDYCYQFEALQKHKKSMQHLQCILECSENSESLKETTNYPTSPKYVEAVILPIQNRAKNKTENPEPSPKNMNLVAQASIFIPGTPGIYHEKSLSKSPKGRSHLSPARRRSPGSQVASVLSKKIKSPVSPVRKNIRAVKPASHAQVPRTPTVTPKLHVSRNKQISLSGKSGLKSTPRLKSNAKLKPVTNSPGLMDVTNTKKTFDIPKLTVTNSSPLSERTHKNTGRFKIVNENGDVNCQRELYFTNTPEYKTAKFFYTPETTPTCGKVRQKKKYFETPKAKQVQNKLPASPGSYRVNWNTVESPVGMYIRGTDPNLITNVRGKTNERLLTPRIKTPKSKSKISSPILARSPCLSPKSSETAGLKFQLTPARRPKQKLDSDILNIALCESDPSSNIGSESSSHSPFPKIFYKPAPRVKMVGTNSSQKQCPKVLMRGTEEKVIYRHAGRLQSATKSKVPNSPADRSAKDSLSGDSIDVSLLHQRPAVKSNYLLKK